MFNESEESYIILQNVLLTGISDISFQSPVQEEETNLLGNKGVNRRINKPSITTCNFSKPYNGKDYLQSLTGATNLSGQFIYKNNAIDFTDAAISSYALDLDSNGFGKIKVRLQIFGEMRPTTNLKLSTASGDFEATDQTPQITHFNLDNKNSAIKSLNYEASFDVKPTNNIGSINSSSVNILSPVTHRITADIEMLEQEVEDVTGLVREDEFNKKIDIVFSPKENELSINRIFEIQSIAENIKSSGINLDDLDFSIGSCAINSFQFNKASLISQKLNSSAGEVVQLSNEYSAYSIINKVAGSLPILSEFNTCTEHLSNLEANLNEAQSRWNTAFLLGNRIDFESESIGEIDLQDVSFFGNRIDFESESIGEIDLIPVEPYLLRPASGRDFERDFNGAKDLIQLTGEYNFHNETDFEALSAGSLVGLNLLTGEYNFHNETDFEALSAGSLVGLNLLTGVYNFHNETDFEALSAGSSVNLNLLTGEYNFHNETDFETTSTGETDTNLHNL